MKIALIKTYTRRILSSSAGPPLGIAYLAGYLRKQHPGRHQFLLLDMALDQQTRADIMKKLAAFDPDLVGFSTMTPEANVMHELAKSVKTAFPTVPVLVGGPHPTAIPKAVLHDTNIDCVVRGEGEKTLTRLVERLESGGNWEGLEGCVYRRDGEIVIEPPADLITDLDTLPFPAWDLLDFKAYSDERRISIGILKTAKIYSMIFTTRGCPYGCAYCHNIFGKHFRVRSVDHVLEELRWLKKTFGVSESVMVDDAFNLDKARALEFFERNRSEKIDFRFSFCNGLRTDVMDEEIIHAMKKGGAYLMAVAVESGSERIQKLIHKNLNLEKVKRNIEILHDTGIFLHGYFMLGFPTETYEEMRQSVQYALDSKLDAAYFFRVIPFPGTELHAMVRGDRDNERREWSQFHFLDWEYGDEINCSEVPAEKINLLQKEAIHLFYFRSFRVLRTLWRYPKGPLVSYIRRYIRLRLLYLSRHMRGIGPIARED